MRNNGWHGIIRWGLVQLIFKICFEMVKRLDVEDGRWIENVRSYIGRVELCAMLIEKFSGQLLVSSRRQIG